MTSKITAKKIKELKGQRKIASLTAYDYPFAKILDEAGIDLILVGDSLGMVVFGERTTKGVTMEDMLRATSAVRRGVKEALLVSDLPYGSFDDPDIALKNAKKLIEAGAEAVKIEGYGKSLEITQCLISEGIEVMGHLGLTPQIAEEFKVQGKTKAEAEKIYAEALEFDKSGIFSLVLECIPSRLAARITENISIPTIGIGAGNETDGQILVTHDILGLAPNMHPKFVRKFVDLPEIISKSVQAFKESVASGDFPNETESFKG